MTTVHGRDTVITVGAKDISPWCKSSSLEVTPDIHDNSGYGTTAKTKNGGLLDNKFSCSGTYDNTALTSPGVALRPIVGTSVTVTRKLEGTGTGKPLDTFTAVVGKYVETSPVDDNVSWSCDFEISGTVVTSTQP